MGLVQGSFNQGYVTLLGETVGRQCACNALFSICWSVVSSIVIKGTRAKDVNYFFKGVLKKIKPLFLTPNVFFSAFKDKWFVFYLFINHIFTLKDIN